MLEKIKWSAGSFITDRVLNYIDSKQVVQRDDCGYLDLQKVKLELLLGEYDAACKDFDSLVNRSSDLRDTSVIKNHLINVESARRALYLASEVSAHTAGMGMHVDSKVSAAN